MPGFTEDIVVPVSRPRYWLALKDGPKLFPKIAPHFASSIDHVDGVDEEVGAVRLIKFGPSAPPGAFVKEKLIVLDHASWTVTTEEIEGGHLAQGFTKWWLTLKLTAIDDNSTNVKAIVEYEHAAEVDHSVVEKTKEGLVKLFSGLAAYVQNSGAYA